MWKSSIDDRLTKWHKFRQELNSLPLKLSLEKTAEFWANAPFTSYLLNLDNIADWPDPWSLILEPRFCEISKCLGIIYTIYFTTHKNNIVLDLRVYQDLSKCQLYALVFVNDGEYIFNYEPGQTVSIEHIKEKDLQLLRRYTISDLAIDNY